MGEATSKILKGNCTIEAFLDKNRDGYINGIPVLHPERLCGHAEVLNDLVVIAMAACAYYDIKKYLIGLGFKRVIPAGDYVSKVYKCMKFTNIWSGLGIEGQKFDHFGDERSFYNYCVAIRWFKDRQDEGFNIIDRKRYFPDFLREAISSCRSMLDTATLEGEYIDTFLLESPERKVYANILKPEIVSMETLKEKYGDRVYFLNGEAGDKRGELVKRRVGLMEPFANFENYTIKLEKIDLLMKNVEFDYLRCYSMSEVLPILKGAADSICKWRPIMAVNIGHYKSDFIQVPLYLYDTCKNYKFYFREHSYQGNDCIFYALPSEKIEAGLTTEIERKVLI